MTTFDADELDRRATAPTPRQARPNTLVLSAGCHSGYNIVDGAAAGVDQPSTGRQRMAQQHAVLIGGTGYQYGDTDFLEYSERLYLDIARRLHEGPGRPATRAGRRRQALALAKQDYLAGLGTLDGHRPEGGAPGHALRPADDRLRRPGRAPLGLRCLGRSHPRRRRADAGETLGLATDDLDGRRRPTTPRHQGARSAGRGPARRR